MSPTIDRICYVTFGTGAGHYHYALNLLEGMHETQPDIDIDVFYSGTSDSSHFPEYVSEYHYAYLGHDNNILNIIKTLFLQIKLVLYLIYYRPDIVHANTHLRSQWYTVIFTIISKSLGFHFIRTVHERTDQRLGEVKNITIRLSNFHLRLADHIIVHTESMKNELMNDGITTPSTVIPHGNYCFFRESMALPAKSPYDGTENPVVTFFGVKEHKGISVFLDAVTQTTSEFEPWVVGPVNENDRAYANQARAQEIIHTDLGFIPDEELWRYFHFSDLVILPYTSGTTSGALHLALAFENAVIASNLPCFTEYIEDKEHAIILPEVTPQALSDSIDFLISSPEERQQMAKRGFRLEQSNKFSWKAIAEKTIEVYENVAI